MGEYAVELLLKGECNRIVRLFEGKICDIGIEEGLAMKKTLPEAMIKIAKKLSV